jgi:hypothetical protein
LWLDRERLHVTVGQVDLYSEVPKRVKA